MIHRVLQTGQLTPSPASGRSVRSSSLGTGGDRAHRGNGAARHEHQLQIQRAGERDQTRHPEIDGTVLNLGDVPLRYGGIDAQLALTEPLGVTGVAQRTGEVFN